jgi:hypothetical protein
MIRIIDNTAYQSTKNGDFAVKVWQTGNHIEVTATRKQQWEELDWSPRKCATWLMNKEKWPDQTEDERQATCAKIAAARAKKNVRRLCKAMAADTLLTLTYRGEQLDLALCKAHLKEFVRRVKRVWPTFCAVAAFETQKRGVWHVHMATVGVPKLLNHKSGAKVKSYNLLRSIWRAVTGQWGGNVDVAKSKSRQKRSPAKIAAYIAKYISKDYELGEKWSNRWTKFGDIARPLAIELGTVNKPEDMIVLCYGLLDSHAVVSAHFSKWGDWFFLHGELENQAIKNRL